MSELSLDELRELVDALADQPERWREHVAHGGERAHVMFVEEEDVEVWVISWGAEHDTGFHDHDVSGGAIRVVTGAVREERLRLGGTAASRVATAGETITISAADIHRVVHDGDGPAVTLHAYSPRLRRQGAYVVADDGGLQRFAIAGDESLHPRSVA